MSQYQWENELRQWLERSRNVSDDLIEAYIRFFTLAFDNTECSERAWFGIHNNTASLVVGGIFLAAVIKSGRSKGIWLLLQDAPDIEGWESWNTRSTQTATMPLKWFHTPLFDKVWGILDNTNVWQAYRIASIRILDFPVVAADRDSVQEARKKVRLSTIHTSANDPIEEIQKYQSSYADLPETERKAVIQSRVGQGKFRANLIQYWGECAVTSCKRLEVLRASHIKPWSKSSNIERLDKYNGLLLVPNLDVVFDAGYISFADDGSIIISSFLTEDDLFRLGIHTKLSINRLDEQHFKYLQYHRQHAFKEM